MENNNNDLIKAKKIECWIGITFLIPPILGLVAFVLCLFGVHDEFTTLNNLSRSWTTRYDYANDGGGGGGMSAAPIYLAIMAMVGAYLIKGNIKYLFHKTK